MWKRIFQLKAKRETLNWCVMKLQIPVANLICWSTADYLYSSPTMYMFYQGLATIAGSSDRNISRNVTAAEQFHATVNRCSRHSSCLVWQGRGPVLIKSFPGLVLHSLSRSQLVRYNCSWFFCQRVDVDECCCRTRYSAWSSVMEGSSCVAPHYIITASYKEFVGPWTLP